MLKQVCVNAKTGVGHYVDQHYNSVFHYYYLRLCSLWIQSDQTTRHCVDLGENISVFLHDHRFYDQLNSTHHSVCLRLGEGAPPVAIMVVMCVCGFGER